MYEVKVAQLCLTLCDPVDYTVHGILQTRILEPLPSPGDLPNPGIQPSLLHCRWILNQLSHKGSPRILEWVAYPFYNWGLLNYRQILYQLKYEGRTR